MIGSRIGNYRILEKLGQGGMGEVYRAEDERLKRVVAIKVLRHQDREAALRFLQEARAASALNHPNIVQIYELESQDGGDFIVMELAPGRTLAQLLRERLPGIAEALDYASQLASALAAAHAAGIVHRDIKPANIVVSDSGAIKILDFGIAKLEPHAPSGDSTETAAPETVAGSFLGTVAYASPEQAQGRPVDARTDIFSAGAVMYEMLTGARAFDGDSTPGILSKVLRDQPPPIRDLRAEVPPQVARIVDRCLEKDAARRYPSGAELAADLLACRPAPPAGLSRRARLAIAAVLVAAIGSAGWLYYRSSRARWTRNEALPKIRELIGKSDYPAAFDLTRRALSYVPDDPQLKQQWSEVSLPLTMTTTPPGVTVSYRPYGDAALPWRLVGQTPLQNVRVPLAYMRVRLAKEGWEPAEFATHTGFLLNGNLPLSRPGEVTAGMVKVPSQASWAAPNDLMPLPDYFLDKFEVTNREYQQFVDAGGYRDAKNWRHSFLKDHREIPREQALLLFRDTTGRPGPAHWELGAFPKGQAEFPVSGVSWFEAAAYCESVGKTLPTVHHWRKAAAFDVFSDILLFSNFSGTGPARVGANPGITTFGAYDMAGNVKEWCWNQAGELRSILGGGWNEPSYAYRDDDAQDPMKREVAYGVRCAVYPSAVPAAALAPVGPPVRDYSTEKPVSDETFEIFRRMYAYDRTPLNAKTESVDDSNEDWRKQKVSYAAAYGGERIPAYLYLPRNAKPPYQTVLWVPGGYAWMLRNSETGVGTEFFNFLLRTGRAVLYPVYQGTFERHTENGGGPNARRDWTIQFAKDVSRSVDYLESRPDIRSDRLAYYGLSYGGTFGTIFLALEPRLKTGILAAGGLFGDKPPPEADVLNFAPRVRVPVLMLNGRYDFVAPSATLQLPMFRWLGTAEADKRLIQFDTGHMPPVQDLMRETLNWLDRYIGPVPPM